MVHIHREIILNLSENIVLSVLTFLRLYTQGCTLCYLISRFQRFLTIKLNHAFTFWENRIAPEAGSCQRRASAPVHWRARPRYFRLTTVSRNGKIPPGSPPCPSTVESLQA